MFRVEMIAEYEQRPHAPTYMRALLLLSLMLICCDRDAPLMFVYREM